MLGIDGKYYIGKKIPLTKMIPAQLGQADKKKIRDNVKQVTLSYQIAGEEIPSLINEKYNCQVIMFFSVELENLKEAGWIGEIFQKQLKPFCIFRFYDDMDEVYECAEKRLHSMNREEIVVESTVVTPLLSVYYKEELEEEFERYICIDKLINKQDKVKLYRELLLKIYLLGYSHMAKERLKFFESKIWYNTEKVMLMYHTLKRINQLEVRRVGTLKEKMEVNEAIKIELHRVEELLS